MTKCANTNFAYCQSIFAIEEKIGPRFIRPWPYLFRICSDDCPCKVCGLLYRAKQDNKN